MSEQKYFYISNGQQTGPVALEELLGKITPDTDIWTQGMDNWAHASTVPEVASLLAAGTSTGTYTPPAPPQVTQYAPPQDVYPANPQPSGVPPQQKPDNYLVWTILSTILCCSVFSLPFGIISIIHATRVDKEWSSGQYDEARLSSEKAKKFAIITAVVGLVCNVIAFIFQLTTGILSNLSNF